MSKVLFINQSSKKTIFWTPWKSEIIEWQFCVLDGFFSFNTIGIWNECLWLTCQNTFDPSSGFGPENISRYMCCEFKPKELKEKVLITSIRACCIVMPAGENNGHVGHSGHAVLELPVAWYWKLDSSPSGRARPATVSWGIAKSQQVSNSSPWQVK